MNAIEINMSYWVRQNVYIKQMTNVISYSIENDRFF